MLAYDRLPAELRRAFREAVDDWCVHCIMERAPLFGERPLTILNLWNRAELADRGRDRRRAVGAYAGNYPEV